METLQLKVAQRVESGSAQGGAGAGAGAAQSDNKGAEDVEFEEVK